MRVPFPQPSWHDAGGQRPYRVAGAVGVGECVEEGVEAALHQLHKRLLQGLPHNWCTSWSKTVHKLEHNRPWCGASQAAISRGNSTGQSTPNAVEVRQQASLRRKQRCCSLQRCRLCHPARSSSPKPAMLNQSRTLMGYLRLPHSTECSRMWGTPRLLATGVLQCAAGVGAAAIRQRASPNQNLHDVAALRSAPINLRMHDGRCRHQCHVLSGPPCHQPACQCSSTNTAAIGV